MANELLCWVIGERVSKTSYTAVSQQGHRYLTDERVTKAISQRGRRELTAVSVIKTISQ